MYAVNGRVKRCGALTLTHAFLGKQDDGSVADESTYTPVPSLHVVSVGTSQVKARVWRPELQFCLVGCMRALVEARAHRLTRFLGKRYRWWLGCHN